MKYNICLVQPRGYAHNGSFLELAELLHHGIADLGFEVSRGVNRVTPDARNIIIGCHLLDRAMAASLPSSTIVLNTEQIQGGPEMAGRSPWEGAILHWLSRFEGWDYSQRNIAALAQRGIQNMKFLPLGYHPALARIDSAVAQDIDVLFYGSVNERRQKILSEIERRGLKLRSLFGVYGTQRDNLIARSKVILNHHFLPTQIFEIVRVFYLMTNAKAVATEVNSETSIPEDYRDGVHSAPYETLADACERLVADDALRSSVERRAHACIQRMPQSAIMRQLLDG